MADTKSTLPVYQKSMKLRFFNPQRYLQRPDCVSSSRACCLGGHNSPY